MKKLFIYYLKILLPLPIIALFAELNLTWIFIIFLAFYVLIYRTIIDSEKLILKGVITKKNRWRLLIPFWHIKYFDELYLKK